MKLVAAPRSAIRPTRVSSASPILLRSAAAEDEADAAGDRQRGERFFPDVFADVALASTHPFDCICRGCVC